MSSDTKAAGPPTGQTVSAMKPTINVGVGATASAVVTLLVVMGELSRLSGEILDQTGRSWAFGTLMGPGRLLDPFTDGWSSVFPNHVEDRAWWLIGYVLLDFVFIWLYGSVIARWLEESWPSLSSLSTLLRWLAVVDIAEDALALVAGILAAPAASSLSKAVGVFSMLKWVLVLAVVVLGVRRVASPTTWARIKIWLVALDHQRFSILAVLPLAVLSIPAGSDLLDQLPDAQRRWVHDGQGALNAAFAVVIIAMVTAGILLLGRLRSGAIWRRTAASVSAEKKALLRLGIIPPAAVGVAMMWIWARGSGTPLQTPGFNPARLAAFLSVPVAIMAASWLIRWLVTGGTSEGTPPCFIPKYHRVPTDVEKRAIILAGDILAVTAVVVAGLGLVRSFTPIAALELVGLVAWSWPGTIAFAAGVLVSISAWRWCVSIFAAVTREDLVPPAGDEETVRTWYQNQSRLHRLQVVFTPSSPMPPRLGVRLGVITSGIVIFFAVGAAPSWFGATVGIIGTALLALLAMSLVVGGVVVALQDRLAPELFWFKPIRLSSLPVATLLAVVVVWTSGLGSNVDVHGVRGLASRATPAFDPTTRPTLVKAIGDWGAATSDCGHLVTAGTGQYRLHPMFLLAAEGGGIRAAYWTAASLDLLRGVAAPDQHGLINWATGSPENRCARALFSGGASGGAVGLTVSRFAVADSARDRVVAMAGPDALGAATSGLLVRDTAYSATGVPFFGLPATAGLSTNGPQWLDRGGLIEKSWESTSGLGVPFLPADSRSASTSVTGGLVLNSTRVSDGCRVWVSQLRLADRPEGGCDSSGTPSGHTVDLLAAMSNAVPGGAMKRSDHCLGPISAATGALLASRFPFVTPSGVIGPCNGNLEQQLVDGGYVENTGLATILDLAPRWLREVQRLNTAALTGPTKVKDLIVPIVMYLDNGTGGDLVTDPPPPTSELLVPSTTTGRAKFALIDTPALLRNAERIIMAPNLFDAGSGVSPDLLKAVKTWRREPVVVVHQSTFPAVTAPLGWVLSQESIETMDRALAQQAKATQEAGAGVAISSRGSLADALRLVRPDPG